MSKDIKQPGGRRQWWRNLTLGLTWVAVAGAGYWYGRHVDRARAEVPLTGSAQASSTPSEWSRRVVAYIYDNVPITREDLGEYLIARQGSQKVTNLINKRIIEHAAKLKGIEITAAEVEAALAADLAGLGVSKSEFVSRILKAYGKTLYEWKEDVIRPKLMMTRLCRGRVTVSNEDLVNAFQAHYGEKVDCKIIMYPAADKHNVLHKIWPKIRNDEKEFDHYARTQPSPSLASVGGHIKPIGRNTTGDPKLEKVIFSLRQGEVSEVLDTAEGLVIVKCLGRVPPDTNMTIDKARQQLEKEVYERKERIEIAKLFQELQTQARPRSMITRFNPDDQPATEPSVDPATGGPVTTTGPSPAPAKGVAAPNLGGQRPGPVQPQSNLIPPARR